MVQGPQIEELATELQLILFAFPWLLNLKSIDEINLDDRKSFLESRSVSRFKLSQFTFENLDSLANALKAAEEKFSTLKKLTNAQYPEDKQVDRVRLDKIQMLLDLSRDNVDVIRTGAQALYGSKVGAAAVAATATTTLACVFAVPVVMTMIGFGSGGVIAGSTAAGLQSAIYGAYTTGVFSVCQSVGAAGLASSTIVTSSAVVGVAGGGTAAAVMAPKIPHKPDSAKTISTC